MIDPLDYLQFSKKVARRVGWKTGIVDWDDIDQEGALALVKAAPRFDSENYDNVEAFLGRCVRNAVRKLMIRSQRQLPVRQLTSPQWRRMAGREKSPFYRVMVKNDSQLVRDSLEFLKCREREVFERRVLGGEAMTSIARSLGVSRAWAHYLYSTAVKKIRNGPHAIKK
mgnify:CR=1 FL=1